jgi:hypothetical protein
VDHVQTALRFSEWALEFMLVPPLWILFGLAAGTFLWAWQKQRPFRRRLWKPYHWLVLTHLLFFAAAIAIGVLWENPVTIPVSPTTLTDPQFCS